jgi:hypothetical protein
MAGTETTTNAAKNFIENPLKVMGKVTDLPGIGKATAKILEPLGIKSSRQMFGLYLQFEDPEDFADFLEGKGVKWYPSGYVKDPRNELLNTLKQKWLVVQVNLPVSCPRCPSPSCVLGRCLRWTVLVCLTTLTLDPLFFSFVVVVVVVVVFLLFRRKCNFPRGEANTLPNDDGKGPYTRPSIPKLFSWGRLIEKMKILGISRSFAPPRSFLPWPRALLSSFRAFERPFHRQKTSGDGRGISLEKIVTRKLFKSVGKVVVERSWSSHHK